MAHGNSDQRWTARAHAKVNLSLRVLAKRPDGYHDIETVMSRIGLADTLSIRATSSGELRLNVELAYPRSLPITPIPIGPDNLVLRAAELLRKQHGVSSGAEITLTKRIPSAAGLGGGSSDAATALVLLNRAWRLHRTLDELRELGSGLGSDVPFFLADSACALCTGRGERLQSFSARCRLNLVVVRPSSGLSTPEVYRHCVPEPTSPSSDQLIQSLEQGDARQAAHRLQNSLQRPAERLNPDVMSIHNLFTSLGLWNHQLTGSGSAYFGVCASFRQARHVARRLRLAGIPWAIATQTCL